MLNKNRKSVISYALAAIAVGCFVPGLAILSSEGGQLDHGQNEKICSNA